MTQYGSPSSNDTEDKSESRGSDAARKVKDRRTSSKVQQRRKQQRKRNHDSSYSALKEYLRIPQDDKIPKTILRRIKDARPNGQVIENPLKTGREYIKVTPTLKNKVVSVWNANYHEGGGDDV